jgi:hypothetical protein
MEFFIVVVVVAVAAAAATILSQTRMETVKWKFTTVCLGFICPWTTCHSL